MFLVKIIDIVLITGISIKLRDLNTIFIQIMINSESDYWIFIQIVIVRMLIMMVIKITITTHITHWW